MRCFVTGATGFIGQHLVRQLIVSGCKVKIVTRGRTDFFDGEVEYLFADLLTAESDDLYNFISDCDVVFHCAGVLNDQSLMRKLHVDATSKLIEQVHKVIQNQGRNIHWVQLSSVGAYGPTKPKPSFPRVVTEETPCNPDNEYEVTKTLSDELLLKGCHVDGFTFSILRPSNVFGALMKNQSLKGLINAVVRGKFFFIGDRNAIATYVHVDDVVEALILCSSHEAAKNEIFNLSSDCPQKILIESIADFHNIDTPKLVVPEFLVRMCLSLTSFIPAFPLTKSRVDSLVCKTHYDITKIEKHLGFYPKKNIKDCVSEL